MKVVIFHFMNELVVFRIKAFEEVLSKDEINMYELQQLAFNGKYGIYNIISVSSLLLYSYFLSFTHILYLYLSTLLIIT